MSEQPTDKAIVRWTSQIMLGLLGDRLKSDRMKMRNALVSHIDDRGLSIDHAAALHTLRNTEQLQKQFEALLAPKPGERTSLERILALLEVIAKSTIEIQKGQLALADRLSAFELQFTASSAISTNPSSPPNSAS